VRSGKQVAILNFGALLPYALLAANQLNATVVDMRWVKPMDTKIIETLAGEYDLLVTLEDNAISGGAGSGVNQCLVEQHLLVGVLNLGIPDAFIEHGTSEEQHAWIGLDGPGIERAIKAKLNSASAYAPTKEHLSR
jgi:1-deoxy-D-xylulose-5-phosphate synthase